MVEHYPGDGADANGFGRRHLREDEARLQDPDTRMSGGAGYSAT